MASKITPAIAACFENGRIIPRSTAQSHPQTPSTPYDGQYASVKNLRLKGTGFEKREDVIIFPETLTTEKGLGEMVEVIKIGDASPELIPAPINIFKLSERQRREINNTRKVMQ